MRSMSTFCFCSQPICSQPTNYHAHSVVNLAHSVVNDAGIGLATRMLQRMPIGMYVACICVASEIMPILCSPGNGSSEILSILCSPGNGSSEILSTLCSPGNESSETLSILCSPGNGSSEILSILCSPGNESFYLGSHRNTCNLEAWLTWAAIGIRTYS